jgi:uroporphyrin-III C-methyltransferase
MKNNSTLYLVGAGPGDPELITIKALRILKSAEVVLYDALVNSQLLEHLPAQCIKVFVGKRLHQHSVSQAEINALIVQYGSTHQQVVRLKGGDPFIFGRAQEEIMAARSAGMRVEVIPGISSVLAVPALQGIQLTSRGVADSFWVATGTTAAGELPEDMVLAAQSAATVVIVMGMHQLAAIQSVFLQYRSANTPVAIVQNGSLPNEQKLISTLQKMMADAVDKGLGHPAVIVIGEVVKAIDFF